MRAPLRRTVCDALRGTTATRAARPRVAAEVSRAAGCDVRAATSRRGDEYIAGRTKADDGIVFEDRADEACLEIMRVSPQAGRASSDHTTGLRTVWDSMGFNLHGAT